MPDPSSLSSRHAQRSSRVSSSQRSGLFNGTITEDAVDSNSTLRVRADNFVEGHFFGPCHFEPRLANDLTMMLPESGDKCLLGIDEDGNAWIVTWWREDTT